MTEKFLHQLLGVIAGWLFWFTVLYAIIVADKYHWLDWSGVVPAKSQGATGKP
jgi:hypothetical protein